MVGIGVLINLNSGNEGGKRRKEGRKKERKEEKLVYEGTTIMQTLIIQILRGAPTIPLAIHLPQENSNFKNSNFLEKISFRSSRSRFLIDSWPRLVHESVLSIYLIYYSSVSTLIISR